LVVYNRFSKILHFVAMTEKITAEGLARLFRDNVWKLHGLPESVISDRCYDIVKRKTVIFFIYSSEFYIRFYFGFSFLLLY